jgi:RimJ/RimL family protein N-acetyltransferase
MPSTTGVILRAPAADDLDVLYALASELDTWEERGPQPPRAITRAEFAARFDKVLTEPSQDALFVIEADGAAVGRCALFDIDNLARTAEVGIAIHAPARGRGYGTEALRALVAFAFERCNLRRAHLRVLASNVVAIASYRKVGFVEEGRLRESAWVRGNYEDELVMGLLRSEWLRL